MLQRLIQQVSRAVIRNAGIGSSRELSEFLFGKASIESEAGVDVTVDSAMRLSSVYACVRVLAEDIAKLPLKMYRRIPGGKEVVTSHWLVRLLAQPNPWQTGFEFREMQQAHVELCGNFFAIKTFVGREVRELLPIPPWRMEVKLTKTWQVEYWMTMIDGKRKQVPNELVYHMKGLTMDGIVGLSPVAYQRETMGLGIALRKFGNKMFKNGAVFSGVLQHPGLMEDAAWERLKTSFEQAYQGLDNAHKVLMLEEGTTFQQTGMTSKDAQFLEARKYSRTEVAAIYRVPLHLIGDLDRATFSNIEQQGREYVQNALLGRVTRLEQRMMFSLLDPSERDTFFIEHLLDVLQRGDFATRMTGYQVAVLNGWLTRNEVRSLENMNPGPKELDEFMVPGNMTSAKKLGDQMATDKGQSNDKPQTNDPAEESDDEEALQDMMYNLRLMARHSRNGRRHHA